MRPSQLLAALAVAPLVASSAEVGSSSSQLAVLDERSLESRGLAQDIWNKLKNAGTCLGCQVRIFDWQDVENICMFSKSDIL